MPRPTTWPRCSPPIDHAPSRACVDAERAFLAELGGGCELPAGAYAEVVDGALLLHAFLDDGGRYWREDVSGPLDDHEWATTGGPPGQGGRRLDRVSDNDLTYETTELLQALIRNECVNDGTPESGHEQRSSVLLRDELERAGLDRRDLRADAGSPVGRGAHRRQRSRRAHAVSDGPHRCRAGARRRVGQRDPFGGELVDGEVWGAAPSTCST